MFNADRSKIIKMFLTIPDQRMEVTQEPTVMFKETPEGMPPAVKSWFYPGERTGFEFVYPRWNPKRRSPCERLLTAILR